MTSYLIVFTYKHINHKQIISISTYIYENVVSNHIINTHLNHGKLASTRQCSTHPYTCHAHASFNMIVTPNMGP